MNEFIRSHGQSCEFLSIIITIWYNFITTSEIIFDRDAFVKKILAECFFSRNLSNQTNYFQRAISFEQPSLFLSICDLQVRDALIHLMFLLS